MYTNAVFIKMQRNVSLKTKVALKNTHGEWNWRKTTYINYKVKQKLKPEQQIQKKAVALDTTSN